MGLYDRPYYRDEHPPGFQLRAPTSITIRLLLINVAIFLVDVLMDGQLSRGMAVRADSLIKPWLWWQLLTYGFAHDHKTILHVTFNMIGLYFFGRDVESVYGRRAFLLLYLSSLVLGGTVWAAKEYVTYGAQSQAILVGASGAVTTVVILFALHFPKREVLYLMFLPMPAWIFGIILVLGNLMMIRVDDSGGGRIAYDVHLVGAVFAFVCYAFRAPLSRLGSGASGNWGRWFKPRPKLRVHHPDEGYRDQDENADRVLTKLHREGEASLTRQERRILADYSRRMQQKHR